MKSRQNTDNNPLNTDEEKVKSLIRDHFALNKERRKVGEEEEAGKEEVEEGVLDEIVTSVEIALSGTQSGSAPGLDCISYRFIQAIEDTILQQKVLEEVARNLVKGVIPREW